MTESRPRESSSSHRLASAVRWRMRRLRSRLDRARGRPAAPVGEPIFIVGCGHSGTTLLLAMLSRHSAVHGVPYESGMAARRDDDLDWFVRAFNRATRRAQRQRWVEKTPSHVHHIDRLLHRFPTAGIVFMVRDGRDVACSMVDRHGDFEKAVQRWLDDNAAADPYLEHPSVHLLRYEDLIGEREQVLRSLTEFLDLPFDEAMLNHAAGDFRFLGRYQDHQGFARELTHPRSAPLSPAGEGHRAYRSWQASQPIFDGRGRWRTDMSVDQQRAFSALAGHRLAVYGYDRGAAV